MSRLYAYLNAAFAAVILLLTGSCSEIEPVQTERGRISVSIASGNIITRSLSDDIADGSAIKVDGVTGEPDLVLAIANSAGNLVAWWPDDYWGSMADGFTSECQTDNTDETKSTIYFTGPSRGSYTVFAVANTAGLDASTITALQSATTITALEALQLTVDSGEPNFGSTMPLTARGTLSVNTWGNGQVDLNLQRPVARISLTFVNQTDGPVDIHDCRVTFEDLNPSRGFLFEQEPDYVTGYDRDLAITGADPLVFTNSESSLPVKTVFPSSAPARLVGSRYFINVHFRVTKQDVVYNALDTDTYLEYDFEDLPIHDSRSRDIPSILRNQHLKIETRITKRAAEHDYSFNFEVQDWYEKEEYITFD